MCAVGLRLTCQESKKQDNQKNDDRTDPQQETGRMEIINAARCRIVLQPQSYRSLGQSSAPICFFSKLHIAWQQRNGEFKNA